jgi:ribosomal protein S18 acetylase RimI-like enzyme
MLKHILTQCQADASVKLVYLHVQTTNDEALQFYKRHGFSIGSTVTRYYPNMTENADAYILELEITHTDVVVAKK